MRTLTGTIISNRMHRTVVVRVDQLRRLPKYRKYVKTSAKYHADVEDERNFQIGDTVSIQEIRPLSKTKRWRVVAVVRRAPVSEAEVSTQESPQS